MRRDSCQEQIAQQTERTALHTAHVLRAAIGSTPLPSERPESAIVMSRKRAQRAANIGLFVATGAAAVIGWLGWRWWGRRGLKGR